MEKMNIESVVEQFDLLTQHAIDVQELSLQRILEENGNAEYLQKLGLDGRTDVASFKSCVPLVTHHDLEPYIRRIVDGDISPVLTGKPIPRISISSGTTQGKTKFIPFNEELVTSTMEIFRTSFAFRNRRFPIGKGRALQFIYGSKQFETRGGLKASTATTNVYSSDQFKTTMKDIQSRCSSPDEVIFGSDFQQSLYCHLLCGLVFSDEIQFVSSAFAHSLVNAFQSFELLYEELCEDIRVGCVSSSRVMNPSMRGAVEVLLFPNPELANEIYRKCRGLKDWGGVIPAIFPNARYLYGIMTGSMEPYLQKLRHYAGDLALICADYGSSEGWIGANVLPESPPETATFAVLPNIGFFEFIPLRNEEEVDPVGLQDVKIGEEYEVVVTNFAGLYRYRLGDVVKIAGFYNKTPLLKFQFRRSLLLSINVDKNTEKDLQLAVENASAHLLASSNHLEVIDFTSHADVSSNPGHYVVFWELNADAASKEILDRCADVMDLSLVDIGYVGSRKANAIGALELRVLRKGTFRKILEHYVGMGAGVSQFKTPRCVGSGNGSVLQILSDNVVGNYFSTAYNKSVKLVNNGIEI